MLTRHYLWQRGIMQRYFSLGKLLGAGGQGHVYLAVPLAEALSCPYVAAACSHHLTDSPPSTELSISDLDLPTVAIKVMHNKSAGDNEITMNRKIRESSPPQNIAPLLDDNFDDGPCKERGKCISVVL